MIRTVSLKKQTATEQNTPYGVNKFAATACPGIVVRLGRLAPLHQRAAVARAMRLAGMRGVAHPSDDALARAEQPPAPQWRHIYHAQPEERSIEEAACALAGTAAFRNQEQKIPAPTDRIARAMAEVRTTAWMAWAALPSREMMNTREYEDGQRHAEKWRPVIDQLHTMLDDAERHIPDLYLSASPEGRLREIATMRAGTAEAMQSDIDPDDLTPAQRRAQCPKAQVRVLRRRASKARQAASALFGTVGRGGADYADSYSVARWRERQASAKTWAEKRDVVIDMGDGKEIRVPLSEVIESAAKGNLAQLYAMHLGVDEWAKKEGLTPIFLTLTLPPEYHPNPTHGRAGWNPRFLPDVADAALMRLWANFRARLAKANIRADGLRVVEPHRDGCPHLHAQIYVAPEAVQKVDMILQALRPEPVPGRRRATTLTIIDTNRGSAPTYVLKYLLKARNNSEAAKAAAGGNAGEDGDHLASHDGVRAWASERTIRRFAWVGLHGVNAIWRAIRARKEMPAAAPVPFHEAHAALHANRYADALTAMGALRDGRPRMRLGYEDVENTYGEIVKRATGIRLEGQDEDAPWMALRKHRATIVSRSQERADREYEEAVAAAQARREAATQQARRDGVTVSVSFPRGPSCQGCEGEAGGRTGPPAQEVDGISVAPAQNES